MFCFYKWCLALLSLIGHSSAGGCYVISFDMWSDLIAVLGMSS